MILRPFQSNMVEEEVAKVNSEESGGSDEKGHPQPKQLVQQQCHHGASLDITMTGVIKVLVCWSRHFLTPLLPCPKMVDMSETAVAVSEGGAMVGM